MVYQINFTPEFERQLKKLLKKYQSLPRDLKSFVELIKTLPDIGTPLGFNLYKHRLRITSKGKGKPGGARVITYVVQFERELYLVAIYYKSEIENLTKDQIKQMLKHAGLL